MTTWTYVAGWTLVHFLWQGTLVAAAAAALLHLLRGRDARLRYAVACTALLLMVAAPLVTGVAMVRALPDTLPALTLSSAPSAIADAAQNLVRVTIRRTAAAPSLAAMLNVDTLLPLLVAAWALGVLLLLTRLAGGAWRVQRLHHHAMRQAPSSWQAAAERVAARLLLSRPIRVVDAVAVDTPMVIGWLRPVVLLPIAALANLTTEQVEAILAHELAHIRRHDFAVNLLQTVAETTLFYHPGVWWISSRIRAEREHCCDDIAVAVCGDPLRYAEALTELATWTSGDARLVMAATHRPLLARVRRILGVDAETRAMSRPAAVLTTLVLVGVMTLVATASARVLDNPYSDNGGVEIGSVHRQVTQLLMRFKRPTPPPVRLDTMDPSAARAWTVNVDFPGGRMPFVGYTGRSIIRYAYGLTDMPVVDAPNWLDTESLEIAATTSAVAPGEEDFRYAIRTALEQRLALITHADRREFPVYALTLAGTGLGPDIQASDGSCFTDQMLRAAVAANRPLPFGQRTPLCGIDSGFTGPTGRGATLDQLGRWLRQPILDRNVVNRTGLDGRYDYTLRLGPLPLAYLASAKPWTAPLMKPFGVTTLADALRDQLGLKLDDATANFDVFVVDHAERPVAAAASAAAPAAPSAAAAPAVAAVAAAPASPAASAGPALKRAPWAGAVEKLLGAAAAAQPAAGAAAAQEIPGDVTGTLVDQFDAALPGVQVTLTQGSAQRDATTDGRGQFAFGDLQPGGYRLTLTLPGFRTTTRGVTVRSGETTDVSMTMVIGNLEETVTVVNDGTPPRVTGTPGRRPIPPPPALAGPGGVRIGGNIKPPTKRVHVSPAYPVTGGEGVVVLTTVIGEDGYVKNTTALSAPSDDMARAAIDAINRWEFDPTLLDGRPIDTLMQVTVYFKNQ